MKSPVFPMQLVIWPIHSGSAGRQLYDGGQVAYPFYDPGISTSVKWDDSVPYLMRQLQDANEIHYLNHWAQSLAQSKRSINVSISSVSEFPLPRLVDSWVSLRNAGFVLKSSVLFHGVIKGCVVNVNPDISPSKSNKELLHWTRCHIVCIFRVW